MSRFVGTIPAHGSGAEVLRGHFGALAMLMKTDRQLWAVMGELSLRAPRDPELARIFQNTDTMWQAKLAEMFANAMAEGALDPTVNPNDAAALAVATLKGLALPTVSGFDPTRVDQVFGQLRRWLGLRDQ